MAADLAKVSLWLDAMTPGKPAVVPRPPHQGRQRPARHHPRAACRGHPRRRVQALEGDDKRWAAALRKRNRAELDERLSSQGDLFTDARIDISNAVMRAHLSSVERVPALSLADYHVAQARYLEYESSGDLARAVRLADTWCAAFLQVKVEGAAPITHHTLRAVADGSESPGARSEIDRLAARYRLFHWHLEFPQIYYVADSTVAVDPTQGWTGGFSIILGNPPWDAMSPDKREFFGQIIPGIRGMTKIQQDQLILKCLEVHSQRESWTKYERDLLASVHFLKNSGRFVLYAEGNLGKGDFNVYRNFVEAALSLTAEGGYACQIAPAGLYGGANATAIRRSLLGDHQWTSLVACENKGSSFFENVHPQTWFCIYTAQRHRGPTINVVVGFGVDAPKGLTDWRRSSVVFTPEQIRSQQPLTLALPDVGSVAEAVISAKMYERAAPFGTSQEGMPLRRYQREIDMGNDRDLLVEGPIGLPLYEGRMIDLYDYRAKTYLSGHGNNSKWAEPQFGDPAKIICPQWRVPEGLVPSKVGDRVGLYRVGFGDVANPRNERTFVSTLIPPGTICGDKVPTLRFNEGFEWALVPYLAVANSLCTDFLARQRTLTLEMSYTILDSLPIRRLPLDDPLTATLSTLVLRLQCTGPEMAGFWNQFIDLGWVNRPWTQDDPALAMSSAVRRQIMATLDAIVAKYIYELDADEFGLIMDSFDVLKRREIRESGAYRTKLLCLSEYQRL